VSWDTSPDESHLPGNDAQTELHARLIVVALLAMFVVVLIRTAWLSDDSFINFRTIDNFLHGYGLRWNVAERVQSFTDPLWLFLVTACVFVTRDFYYTPIALSILLSFGAVWLIARRHAASSNAAVVGLVLLLCSKAFVDFSTSGLEGPLVHVLLAGFFAIYWQTDQEPVRRVRRLSLVAALIFVSRMDAATLVVLPLAAAIAECGWRRSAEPLLLGLVPVFVWESFSLVYYGFLLPNTAYAKLGGGVPLAEMVFQGLIYLLDSIALDPLTLTGIGAAIAVTFARGERRDWPAAAGLVMSVIYVVFAGGDFMSGRFLAAPFLCAVLLLVRRPEWAAEPLLTTSVALLAVVASTPSHQSILLTDGRFRHDFTDRDGIVDERRVYYPFTGLMSVERRGSELTHPWAQHAREVLASGERVTPCPAAGFFGFTLGPSVYGLDPFALADPLLAHLPAWPDWRPGHFDRRIPDGYAETLASGVNRFADPAIADFYNRLQIVTREPIWRWRRFREIWRFNTGANAALIARSSYGLQRVTAATVAAKKADGAPSLAAHAIRIREGGVAVEFGRPMHGPVEISLDGNDDYRLVFSRDGREVETKLIRARWPETDGSLGLAVYRLAVPDIGTFDRIGVYAYRGFGAFTMEHVIASP